MEGESGCGDLRLLSRIGRDGLYRVMRYEGEQPKPAILRVYGDPDLALREFELLNRESIDGVLGPPEKPLRARPGRLIFSDYPGSTLDTLLASASLEVEEARRLGIRIAEVLGAIHNAGLLHLYLLPHNVVCGPTDLVVTGMCRSRPLANGAKSLQAYPYPRDSLEYIAPELRAGTFERANPTSDYYSLGAILFRALTGMPAAPTPPDGMRPDPKSLRLGVPDDVSELVMRLLDWEPERRPPTAGEILRTLRGQSRCAPQRPQLHLNGGRPPLAGRYEERVRVEAAVRRAAEGSSELLVVSGVPGIGKTALIARTLADIAKHRRLVRLYGKFESAATAPYYAYTQVIASLAQESLMLTEEQGRLFSQEVHRALSGIVGEALFAFPDLKILVDRPGTAADRQALICPSEPAATSVAQRKSVVLELIVGLMRACASISAPVVLCIDDAQWADEPSIDILSRLFNARIPRLLIVCIYRSDEIAERQELLKHIVALRNEVGPERCIDVAPMDIPELASFAGTRYRAVHQSTAEALGHYLFSRTGGNPFYCGRVLRELESQHLLRFDFLKEEWQFAVGEATSDGDYNPDVVQFIAKQIEELPPMQEKILAAASCCGRFPDPSMLAVVSDLGETTVEQILENLTKLGYLYTESTNGLRRFSHDTVRNAAQTILTPRDRKAIHRSFGRLLRDRRTAGMLYEAADHGIAGLDTDTDSTESFAIAETALAAGINAKASGAFASAHAYLEAALAAVPISAWHSRSVLGLTLLREASEAAFLVGDYTRMEEYIERGLAACGDLLEELPFQQTRINSLMARFRMPAAVDVYVGTLRRLGIRLDNETMGPRALFDAPRTRLIFRTIDQTMAAGSAAVRSTDLAAMGLIASGFSAVYLVNRRIYVRACAEMLRLALHCGASPFQALALAVYASSITYNPSRIAVAVRLVDRAISLVQSRNYFAFQAKINFVAYLFVKPWKEGFLTALEPLRVGFQMGKKFGDYDNASLCITIYCSYNILYGPDLIAAEREAEEYELRLIELHQDRAIAAIKRHRQLAYNLLGKASGKNPIDFSGPCFDHDVMEPILAGAGDSSGLASYRCYMLLIAYLLGDYCRAVQIGESLEPWLDAIENQPAIFGVYLLFYPLSLAAVMPSLSLPAQTKAMGTAGSIRKRLRKISAISPQAYGPWSALIEAEFIALGKNRIQAEELYYRAISGADALGYIRDRALTRERLASYYERTSRVELAELHLREAYELYKQWGAVIKVQSIELSNPWLLGTENTHDLADDEYPKAPNHGKDLPDLAEALSRINEAPDPETLVNEALRGIISITGADRGIITLQAPEGASFALRARRSDARIETWRPLPGEEVPDRYAAYVRITEKTLLLDGRSGAAYTAPTILCFLISKGSPILGLCCLERDAYSSLFSKDLVKKAELLGVFIGTRFCDLTMLQTVPMNEAVRSSPLPADKFARIGMKTASIVHDINNPNQLIAMGVERACAELRILLAEQEDAGHSPAPERRRAIEGALGDILMASKRVDSVIQEIKGTVAGRNLFELVDLNDVLLSTLPLASEWIRKSGARLATALEPSLPPVACAPEKLRQAVLNLIENACQSLPGPDKLVSLSTKKEERYLVLEVSDEGCGIKPEYMKIITAPLFTTKKDSGGTGLGLAIVEEIVSQHRGFLDIRSSVGVGTTVAIRIPINEQDQ